MVRAMDDSGWQLTLTSVFISRPYQAAGGAPVAPCTRCKRAHKAGRVTVPGKPSDDLAPGNLNSILKQAGLK